MGCDIHLYVEQYNGNYWKKVNKIFDDSYFGKTDSPYYGRNYTLFALLNDVRNDGNVEPFNITDELPFDISNELLSMFEKEEDFYHSPGVYTLKQIWDFNWDEEITLEGYVNDNEYNNFRTNKKPDSWCSWVGGSSVKILEHPSEIVERKEGIFYYYLISWKQTLRDLCSDFLNSMKKVEEKLKNYSPEEIRIVFWFDN
jgi:hypothetical protein